MKQMNEMSARALSMEELESVNGGRGIEFGRHHCQLGNAK